MKTFKLRHIPSGLFYQPHKHGGSNLSKKGKIYQNDNHGLRDEFRKLEQGVENVTIQIRVSKNSAVYEVIKDMYEFEKERYSYNGLQTSVAAEEWEKAYLEDIKQEAIEEIVADIRNKIQPVVTYFELKKRSYGDEYQKYLDESEKQVHKSLPIIIEQLRNLTKI